jgi:hypothetical protein
MNKEITYKIVLRSTSKGEVRNLGRYVNKVKYKCFNRLKDLYVSYVLNVKGYHRGNPVLIVRFVTKHYWSSSDLPPHSSIYSRNKKGPGVPRHLAFSKGKE